jgi:magnesium transporter
MKHKSASAERIMTPLVPTVVLGSTVREVEALLRREAQSFKTINYIYVIDQSRVLMGVISIRELLSLPREECVDEHMQQEVVTARAHTDQERVAHLALKYQLKAIPIVTKDQKFLGVVSSDVILTVLNQEHTEDVLRFAGVRGHAHTESDLGVLLLNRSPLIHVRARLPWLILGLGGGVVAAIVVGRFEAILAEQLILAAFIPAVVYMADAVGSQTQMLFIRALAIDHTLTVRSYLWRECKVNLLLGSVLAGLAFIASLAWLGSVLVSAILAISLFFTVWCTVLVAIALPWYCMSRGYDPAVASGPLATVVRDIISLVIYFGVATMLLS